MGVDFWNACYYHTKTICYNNKVKCMQYQICRGSLQVNYVVFKHNATVSPLCTFCRGADETIKHLFYDCTVTKTFIQSCFTEIAKYGHNMNLIRIPK